MPNPSTYPYRRFPTIQVGAADHSWVMNNNWETNFKMDLSGFCQYDYSLWLTDISTPEQAMNELHEQLFDPYVLIVR